jgi:hypothetical protein
MEVLAIVVAAVTIFGGIGTAFAVVQWRDRNKAGIPNLTIKTPDGVTAGSDGKLRITVANTRGAAERFVVIIHAGANFYIYDDVIGANTGAQDFARTSLYTAADSMNQPIKVLAAARDAKNRWWDQLGSRERIAIPINDWLAEKGRAYGRGCPALVITV